MKYEERQQFLKKRERQKREREPLLNAGEYQRFINEPTEEHDVDCNIAGFEYRLVTYNPDRSV